MNDSAAAERDDDVRDSDVLADSDRPPEWHRLRAMPALGYLACVAALLDLSINRVAVRALRDVVSERSLLTLSRWGQLPRNLAAVAGLITLTIALLAFLRSSRYGPIRRRLALAGFAGVFLPTTALATLLPTERTTIQIVVFGVGAANVLAVLLGLVAVRMTAPRGVRVGVALVAVSCFCAFLSLVIPMVEVLRITLVMQGVSLLRKVGEVAFLLAPFAFGASVIPWDRSVRSRVTLATGLVVACLLLAVMTWGRVSLRGDFGIVLYGAERLKLFLDSFPTVYVLPLSLGFGVGVAGAVAGHPARRLAGVGLLLLLCAGYAPTAPGPLLMMVLGVALLARASVIMGEELLDGRQALAAERALAEMDQELDAAEVRD